MPRAEGPPLRDGLPVLQHQGALAYSRHTGGLAGHGRDLATSSKVTDVGRRLTFHLKKKKNREPVLSSSPIAKPNASANVGRVETSDEIPSGETSIPPPARYDSNKHVISS